MKSFLRRLFGKTANPVGYVIQAGQNKVIVKLGCKFAYSFDALVNRTKLLGISEDSIAATGGGVGGKPFSFPQNLHICGNTECLSCSWLYATWGDTGVQAVFQKEKGCYVFVFKHDADGVDSNRKGALVDDVEGKGGAGKSVYFVDIDNPLGAECDAYLLVSDVLDHVDDTQNGSDGGGCDCDHLYPEGKFHGQRGNCFVRGKRISPFLPWNNEVFLALACTAFAASITLWGIYTLKPSSLNGGFFCGVAIACGCALIRAGAIVLYRKFRKAA